MNCEQRTVKETNQNTQAHHLNPAVDIYETATELVLLANMPGVAEGGLQLEIAQGVLTLEGAIGSGENDLSQSYYRQFRLSEKIASSSGNATLKDGVLTLRLPKAEAAKPQKIAVKMLH